MTQLAVTSPLEIGEEHQQFVNAERQEQLLRVSGFLVMEAALLDAQRYSQWLRLWSPQDAHYWIPANGAGNDPRAEVAIIYDDFEQLMARVRRLESGLVHSQVPPSRTSHLISNLVIDSLTGGDTDLTIVVSHNALVTEARKGKLKMWAGNVIHKLVFDTEPAAFKISEKKVILVDNDQPLPAMSFIL